MPEHREQQQSPYSPGQLFDMVADVERYPEFLPWCRAARILERGESEFTAELLVCFSHICESYTSKVSLHKGEIPEIHVELVHGPFTKLANHWKFEPRPKGGTNIDFFLDFHFRSNLLNKLIGGLFHKAVQKMTTAFTERADYLYRPRLG